MKDEIDGIVKSTFDQPENTGLVVGVIKNDRRSIFGYGKARADSDEPPRADTLFEIGSVTKVFTAALFSVAVAEGSLNPNDAIRDLVPQLSNLAPEITLLRLATHTSGLPHMPPDAMLSMLRNRRDPYAAYTTDDLLRYLAKTKSRRHQEAKDRVRYSNMGMALLGIILARVAGDSYEKLLIKKICDRLEMPDTRIALTPEQMMRLAAPHTANGRPSHTWDLTAFAGAGALSSTAVDLLKFLRANLGEPSTTLAEALQACHEIQPGTFPSLGTLRRIAARLYLRQRDIEHYELSIALGWHVGQLTPRGMRVYWRHGATGGYRAFIGFVKDAGAGVVVLENRSLGMPDMFLGLTSADRIGLNVLQQLTTQKGED